MFVLYNILQLIFLPVFLPLLILFLLFNTKYRDRIPARLGIGLAGKLSLGRGKEKTIWLHALSVGEVTSAVPLVAGLRKAYPDHRIVVSTTTRNGRLVADNLLPSLADHIIDGPLDALPVVCLFVRLIRPDLFILVETDLWPNLLLWLNNRKIPTMLVNGRVSAESMAGYRRLRYFFYPMFRSFAFLCLQTRRDRDNMQGMGLPPEKLHTLGNLKFDTTAGTPAFTETRLAGLFPEDHILFICGSTHPGEEKILIDCYCQVRMRYPELFLIIAPRDGRRAAEIQALAAVHGLTVACRSAGGSTAADIFVLDTIGELIQCYVLADIAFVGGSLVRANGHNPIEPAACGLPVIFGPNMQDFAEIADDLLSTGGATRVSGSRQLTDLLTQLLGSPELRSRQGEAARRCVTAQRGVIDRHLELIRQLL